VLDLNKIIEDHTGPELVIFEKEVEAMPQPLLADLVVSVMKYPRAHEQTGDRREFLEIAAGEVTWAEYFEAYLKIMGHRSVLDKTK